MTELSLFVEVGRHEKKFSCLTGLSHVGIEVADLESVLEAKELEL